MPLERCAARARRERCAVYAVDDKVVLDTAAWPTMWRPYKSRAETAKLAVGTVQGQRFPDVAFGSATGDVGKVSDHRGKVVVVHFWVTWCAPCVAEMPRMQTLYDKLRDDADVIFVLMQTGEGIESSRSWRSRSGYDLPLYDSGQSKGGSPFVLADGAQRSFSQIVGGIPRTYILDKHGVILLKRNTTGHWPDYSPFIKDAARQSGR